MKRIFKTESLFLLGYLFFGIGFILYQLGLLPVFNSYFVIRNIHPEVKQAYVVILDYPTSLHFAQNKFKLFEDGIYLTAAHSLHDTIREKGNGAYDISSSNVLRFSTIGNTKIDNHIFTLQRPYGINQYIFYVIIFSVIIGILRLVWILPVWRNPQYLNKVKTTTIYTLKIITLTLAFIGCSLLSLNIISILISPSRNAHANKEPAYTTVLSELNKIEASSKYPMDKEILSKKVSRLFFVGITDYWDKNDKTLAFPWWKNWFLYLFLKSYALHWRDGYFKQFWSYWAEINPTDATLLLSGYEYYNFKDSLARGVGICSQHALAVTDFMRKLGYESYAMGLNGHVVNQTTFRDGKQYILDASYDVVMPFSLEYAAAHPESVKKYYQEIASPLPPRLINLLDLTLNTYTHPAAIYEEKLTKIIHQVEYVAWIIPIYLLALSCILFLVIKLIELSTYCAKRFIRP